MEKEEELVMLDKELSDRTAALCASPGAGAPELAAGCAALAHFHGELVLLEHWCSLNYAGLVKILKKHDKRSSLSLRAPVLVDVLRQPFYSTEILSSLVRATEARFYELSARLRAAATEAAAAAACSGEASEGSEGLSAPSGRLSPPQLMLLEPLPEEGCEGASLPAAWLWGRLTPCRSQGLGRLGPRRRRACWRARARRWTAGRSWARAPAWAGKG